MDAWAVNFAARIKRMNDEFENFRRLIEVKQKEISSSSSMEIKDQVVMNSSPVSNLHLDPVEFEGESGLHGVRASKPSSYPLKAFNGCAAAVTKELPVVQIEGELKSTSLRFHVLPTQQSLIDNEINTVRDHIQIVINEFGPIEKVEQGFNSYTYDSINADLWFGWNKNGPTCLKIFWYFASPDKSAEANLELLWNLELCSRIAEALVSNGTIVSELETTFVSLVVFDPGGNGSDELQIVLPKFQLFVFVGPVMWSLLEILFELTKIKHTIDGRLALLVSQGADECKCILETLGRIGSLVLYLKFQTFQSFNA